MKNKIFYSVYTTAIIIFVSAFVFKYKDLLQLSEMFSILSIGVCASLYTSNKIGD